MNSQLLQVPNNDPNLVDLYRLKLGFVKLYTYVFGADMKKTFSNQGSDDGKVQ